MAKKIKPASADGGDDFRDAVRRQLLAIFVSLIAVLIILGGFGWGGPAPVFLFKAIAWLVGWSAWFLAPTIALYLAWIKFSHQKNTIPPTKTMAMIAFFVAFGGLLHLFAPAGSESIAASQGQYGGQIGRFTSGLLTQFLNQPVSFVILAILALVCGLLFFGITPRNFFDRIVKIGQRRRQFNLNQTSPIIKSLKEIKEQIPARIKPTAAEKKAAKPTKFKLNQAVPLETAKSSETKAKAKAPALTVSDDPDWKFPPLNLLNHKQDKADAGSVQANAETIKDTLADFNIDVEMEGANVGPRVTQYTLKPPSGIKLTKITGLESNIALDLAAQSIRIEAPIPGKRAVGIEVPNRKSATVLISSLMTTQKWQALPKRTLGFIIGKDIAGEAVIGRLEKMPHLMLAGQTGSGKSVAINTLLTSLLYRCRPAELRLILVDPKQVELAPYNDIPHLLTPVITEPEKCISALKWAVAEMERRLKTFAGAGKRNIIEFNNLTDSKSMPFVVIVIDELADLMMMAARDVESLIVRIAQKARAAGIHIVLATQRPSVDVITGLIKANVPARIAFTVASQVDSRTIIDQVGAEKLLGMGDILYQTASIPKPIRVQGALITDDETIKICNFLRQQRPAQYDGEVVSQPVTISGGRATAISGPDGDVEDDMWEQALEVVVNAGKASTSLLQRRLRIGYARAARIIETMEERNIICPADGARPRDLLVGSVAEALGETTADPETNDGDDQPEPEDDSDQDETDLATDQSDPDQA